MKEGPLGARMPHEPSRMRMGWRVTVEDVLASLVGRTGRIPSSTGAQLEKAAALAVRRRAQRQEPDAWPETLPAQEYAKAEVSAAGVSPPKLAITHDPWQAIENAERSMGADLGVLRCLSDLCRLQFAPSRWCRSFAGLQRSAPHRAQGELVVLCLRAYHEWATMSEARALAEVYAWSRRLRGVEIDAKVVEDDFRSGRAGSARKEAATLYADALIALTEWVARWNRKTAI